MPELAYPLCRQTVTLYHPDAAAGRVVRAVVTGAFLDRRVRVSATETGRARALAFVLVIPQRSARYGQDYTLEPGDRVLEGEGADVAWADWADFLPASVPGLCCVQYVDPTAAGGAPCHVEAGGWWTRAGSGAHSLTN